jgi:hypothetical protein
MPFDDCWAGMLFDHGTGIVSRDITDTFAGPRLAFGDSVMVSGVHAWNITVVDPGIGKDMDIRVGICDANDMNPNVTPGDDKFCWAFDTRGYMVHNRKKETHGEGEDTGEQTKEDDFHAHPPLNRLRTGDSCTMMCDMDNGILVMDFWAVGGSITYLYRNLQHKEKGKHLSMVVSLGSPGQKIKITRPHLAWRQ